MNYKILILVFLCFLSVQKIFAETQIELNQKECDKWQLLDKDLNQSYQKVLANYKEDKKFIKKFIKAQRKWLEFRDAYLESIYPDNSGTAYGSIYPMCRCIHLQKLTSDRLRQIEVWLTGFEEGDACQGSVKPV